MRLRRVLYGLYVLVVVVGSARSRGEPLVPVWLGVLGLIFGLVLLIVAQIDVVGYPKDRSRPKLQPDRTGQRPIL